MENSNQSKMMYNVLTDETGGNLNDTGYNQIVLLSSNNNCQKYKCEFIRSCVESAFDNAISDMSMELMDVEDDFVIKVCKKFKVVQYQCSGGSFYDADTESIDSKTLVDQIVDQLKNDNVEYVACIIDKNDACYDDYIQKISNLYSALCCTMKIPFSSIDVSFKKDDNE